MKAEILQQKHLKNEQNFMLYESLVLSLINLCSHNLNTYSAGCTRTGHSRTWSLMTFSQELSTNTICAYDNDLLKSGLYRIE